jgi:hypothetical protein
VEKTLDTLKHYRHFKHTCPKPCVLPPRPGQKPLEPSSARGYCRETEIHVNIAPQDPRKPAAAEPRSRRKILSIAEKPRPEKIRVELNVEKWPALWRPAKSKGASKVRALEREFVTPDGIRVASRLEIGFTQFGTVTTEDQRMFYALIRRWEESGKPADRPVFFSARQLARLLHKGWGTNVIESITSSLRRLRTTPLRWTNSYHRHDSPKSLEEETIFNFLDQLKIMTRRECGHTTNQQGYFQFGRDILQNLLTNYTKPLFDDEFFQLQTEIGQLLYTHVDLILSGKARYKRCTKDLFADLGLLIPENPSYRYASNRAQALRKPIAELIGKRLSTGELKSITLERTTDGKDYNVVFLKGAGTPPEALPAAATETVNQPKSQPAIEAEQLVTYFHQRFHGLDIGEPMAKEIDQATALIARYGVDQARQVVDYAFVRARETKFPVQHFGAVLNYAPRAIAYLDRRRQAGEQAKEIFEIQARQLEKDRERQAQGEARLAALPPEQYQARFQQAQAELYAEHPKLARFVSRRQGGKVHEEMIRVRMIRQLEQEQAIDTRGRVAHLPELMAETE